MSRADRPDLATCILGIEEPGRFAKSRPFRLMSEVWHGRKDVDELRVARTSFRSAGWQGFTGQSACKAGRGTALAGYYRMSYR